MTKTLRRKCLWLAAVSPLTIGIVALGQSRSSQIGREVAVPVHLQDGDEFTTPREQLIEFGAQLFNAKFTIQEGAGRPHSKGTGARGDARLERRGSELPGVVEGGMSRRIDIRKPGTSRHRPRPRRIYCCGTAETPHITCQAGKL
jgi:hypothetical protein